MTPRSDAATITGTPAGARQPGTAGGGLRRMSFLELAPLPSAVPCARLHATVILREWGLRDLAEDAELVISELVTNAVTASAALPERPPVLLHLAASPQGLRIEVHDRSPHNPLPINAGADDDHGRGLAIVAALAHRHGAQRITPGHKIVWAEIGVTGPASTQTGHQNAG